jgi:hypothetical protein
LRKHLTAFLLTLSVIVWGVWCGGQYFNEARVVPKMLSKPPASVVAYNAIPTTGELPFFFPLNPLIFLVSLAALASAWTTARRSRKWLALTAVIGFGVCAALILYLAPLIGGIAADAAGGAPAEEIIRRAEVWRAGNKIRLVVELAGFICSIRALQVWSAEAGKFENAF